MSDVDAFEPSQSDPNSPSPEVMREFPDRGTQWLLADPVHLQGLLQLLQPQLAERLDVNRAQRINRTMIPPDLQKRESDLIFRIPYRAATQPSGDGERQDAGDATSPGVEWEVLIYVLLEHQSDHDPLMALRLLVYMTLLWADQVRAAEDSGVSKGQMRIYPVIPVLFYTGEGGWTTPLDLAHLMELPAELARFVPHWDTLFLNLHRTPPQLLTQFATAVGYALRVMQAEDAPLAELERVVNEALTGLEGLSSEQIGQWRRAAWFVLLLAWHRREPVEYNVLEAQILGQTQASKFGHRAEVEAMAQTMAQFVREEGIRLGRAEGIRLGRAEGIEIGRAQGTEAALRGVLITLLTARFGELPEEVRQSIESAEVVRLNQWLTKAATAETREAVGIETAQ